MQKIIEAVSVYDIENKTQEEVEQWFEEQHSKMVKARNFGEWTTPLGFKKTDGRNIVQEDPIDKAIQKTKVPVSDYLNAWVLDNENKIAEHEWEQNNFGRYPDGYRHYENYANYSQVITEATIEDYMQEMNRQVRYDEYVAIIRRAVLNLANSPVGRIMLSQNKELQIPTFQTDK